MRSKSWWRGWPFPSERSQAPVMVLPSAAKVPRKRWAKSGSSRARVQTPPPRVISYRRATPRESKWCLTRREPGSSGSSRPIRERPLGKGGGGDRTLDQEPAALHPLVGGRAAHGRGRLERIGGLGDPFADQHVERGDRGIRRFSSCSGHVLHLRSGFMAVAGPDRAAAVQSVTRGAC